MANTQIQKWKSDFGKEYTNRNEFSPDELDLSYVEKYGIPRKKMNEDFLQSFDLKSARILEVGCNIGNQLRMLQSMGYENLWGIEIQDYAVEKSKELTEGINIIKASGDDIPFKDNYFDLIFTSGVLIHISPKELELVMSEIFRCTKKYIWGFEYFSEELKEIDYRSNSDLLWKANYGEYYKKYFPQLQTVKQEKYKYLDSENYDAMFLLDKR